MSREKLERVRAHERRLRAALVEAAKRVRSQGGEDALLAAAKSWTNAHHAVGRAEKAESEGGS